MFENFDYALLRLSEGFVTTVWITAVSFAIALIIGGVLAMMHVSPAPPARWAANVYTQFFRNVPLLCVLVIFLAGLTEIGIGRNLSPFVWAIIGLSAYTGAFVGETLRSGINSISLGQAEAARSIGLTFGQSLRHVVLPQAFRSVVPPLGSLFTALVKNTALVSSVGVLELSGYTKELVQGEVGPPVSVWLVILGVCLCYLAINLPASYLIRLAEQRAAITR